MTKYSLIFIFSWMYSVYTASAQSNRVDTLFYTDRLIETIDSFYTGDSIKMEVQYHVDMVQTAPNTWTIIDNGQPQQIASQGELLEIRENYWVQHGLWTHWYKNGAMHRQILHPEKGGIRYINLWLQDGNQILTAGNGYYYERCMEMHNDYGCDSTVYQIKDSLKNGAYQTFLRRAERSYYVFETGQYVNNKQQPLRIRYFESGKVLSVSNYKGDWPEGEYHQFFENGRYDQYGYYLNGNKSGHWNFWNDEGVLVEGCNYERGRLKGAYTAYHPNGKLKCEGNYVHINGIDTTYTENLETGQFEVVIIELDNIPAKDGEWHYYNAQGELIRKEHYVKGKMRKD